MGSKKTTTTSDVDLPEFVTDASEQATRLGMGIASSAYQPYTGKRIADLSGNESRALNLAAAGNGRAQQYVDQGTDLLKAGKGWDQASEETRKAYEEPIFQAVTQPAIENANKTYDAARTNLTTNKALLSAKGEDSYNLSSMALDRNLNTATSDITAQGRYAAYEGGREQYQADQARQMQVAEALRAVGGDITRLNAQQIQDLMATGEADRILGQQNLDFNYQQFQEGQNWDRRNLDALMATLQGTKGLYDYTERGKTKESGGELGQVLGAATSLAGAYYGGAFGGGGDISPVNIADTISKFGSGSGLSSDAALELALHPY